MFIFPLPFTCVMTRVVVVGLGHGGMMAASNLVDKVDELYAIERNPYHQLLYKIHLVAAGLEESSSIIIPINGVLYGDGVKVINGSADKVDLNNRLVYVNGDKVLRYDYLIISVGSRVEYYNINGADRYTLKLGSVKDAIAINNSLRDLSKGSIVTIVGGGSTGISLAGALADAYYGYYKIRVIEALDNILAGWHRYIVDNAERILEDDGVEIIKGKKVVEVSKNKLTLDDGTSLDSNLTVWTAGIKAGYIDIMQDVKRNKQGRIVVDKYSRIEGYDDAFAVGDVSAFNLSDGSTSPQSAQFAIRQAYQVAKNIVRLVKYGYMKPIVYNQSGHILSLGRRCIGVINNVPINGILCNYIEDFITYNYINAIKSKGNSIATLAYEYDPLATTITFMNFISYISNRITHELLHAMLDALNDRRDLEKRSEDMFITLCPCFRR